MKLVEINVPDDRLTDGAIELRLWREDDIPVVVEACQDPEIHRWMPLPWPYTKKDAREWIGSHQEKRAEGESVVFAITDSGGEKALGSVGLEEINWEHGRAVVGYWIAKHARRQGVATRAVRLLSEWALNDLGLMRLSLLVFTGNTVSERVAENAGFTREGLMRSYFRVKNRKVDATMFSLVSADAISDGSQR